MPKYVVCRMVDIPQEMPENNHMVIDARDEISAVEIFNSRDPDGGGVVIGRIDPNCRINIRLGSIDTKTLKNLWTNGYLVPVNY